MTNKERDNKVEAILFDFADQVMTPDTKLEDNISQALSQLNALYKPQPDKGMVEEIDILIRDFLIKWIKEDKQDMGIGTLRRQGLSQAIASHLQSRTYQHSQERLSEGEVEGRIG